MGRISGLFSSSVVIGSGAALLLMMGACNEHPVDFAQASGSVEHIIEDDLGGGHEIDILWMIDNSGSMCRSQQIVRNSIDDFVEILTEVNLDFHMGVTTTHMADCDNPDYESVCNREPVAVAGHLQSTPQPIPGFDPACSHPVFPAGHDQAGEPDISSIEPVIDNINIAIECTQNPDQWQDLANVNETQLRCALPGAPGVDSATDCGEDNPSLEEFFPDPNAYRDLPVVFRSEDYTDASGVLDIESFRRDFGCATLVGTRGYGIERGLDAAVTALSTDLTGGPTATREDRDQYPNAGFIRSTADTGVIFISDENDCSHDGTLNENTQCGVHKCTIEENLGDQGALTPIDDLYSDFILNLAASRGIDIDFGEDSPIQSIEEIGHLNELDPGSPARLRLEQVAQSVLPASLHAPYRKVEPVDSPQSCPDDPWRVPTSCRTAMGRGWSGHRYEYFLRNFPNFFPSADQDDSARPLDGLICEDFSNAIEEIADFFRSEATGCIDKVFPCSGLDAACPPHPHTGEEGVCTAYPGDSNSYYCDTGIEVRLVPPEDGDANPNSLLDNTGYCIDGTFDDPAFPNTCVADPSFYEWAGCEGRGDALDLRWLEPEWNQILAGFRTITRYASSPLAPAGDDEAGDGDEESSEDESSDDEEG